MLAGFNTNVRYKGDIYHIQTEDKGIKNPFIVSLIFKQGAIVYSRKTGYSDMISSPDLDAEIREMVKSQHKSVISGLISGSLDREAGLLSEEGKKSTASPLSQDTAIGRQSIIHPKGAPESVLKEEDASPKTTSEKPVANHKRSSLNSSLDDIIIDNIIRKTAGR